MIIFKNCSNQLPARFGIADPFSHIEMEDCSAGVFGLQFVLQFQRFKSVAGVLHRNLGGVGVVRRFRRAGRIMPGKNFLVFFGEAISGAFGRRGFKVVKVAGFLPDIPLIYFS